MARYVALLRAINVGGHNVKMEELRRLFGELGISGATTLIASGNVLFETRVRDVPALERRIAAHLRMALGYDVATLVRSAREMEAVAAYDPFPTARPDDEASLLVMFLAAPPGPETVEKVSALRSRVDDLRAHGREVYWRCSVRIADSAISGGLLEKVIGAPGTMRNITTIRKLAALLSTTGAR